MKFSASDIRTLRQSRDLQQKAVANILRISTQRYSVLENDDNRPDCRTMEILTALKYSPESAKKFLSSIPPVK